VGKIYYLYRKGYIMDIIDFIVNAENLRTLFLFVSMVVGVMWLDRRMDQKMDTRFVAFHKMLKENDFAHIAKTIEALTFMLQKNGFLKPEEKRSLIHILTTSNTENLSLNSLLSTP